MMSTEDKGPPKAGVPELIEIAIGNETLSLPKSAFEDGVRSIFLSEGISVGIDDYALSVEEFLSALKETGFSLARSSPHNRGR